MQDTSCFLSCLFDQINWQSASFLLRVHPMLASGHKPHPILPEWILSRDRVTRCGTGDTWNSPRRATLITARRNLMKQTQRRALRPGAYFYYCSRASLCFLQVFLVGLTFECSVAGIFPVLARAVVLLREELRLLYCIARTQSFILSNEYETAWHLDFVL